MLSHDGAQTKKEGRRELYLVLLFEILLPFAISGFSTDLLVVLLEGGKILASLGEFALLKVLKEDEREEK